MAVQSTTKTIYTTTDGQEFGNYVEASVHQTVLDETAHVERFVLGYADEPRQQTRVRNLLNAFIKARAEDVVANADA